jgi:hypothetical protein
LTDKVDSEIMDKAADLKVIIKMVWGFFVSPNPSFDKDMEKFEV